MKRSVFENLGKEGLQGIVNSCSCLRDVLHKVGLSGKGTGNYITLRSYLLDFKIDMSVLEENKKSHSPLGIKIPLEDILVEHSTYNRFYLKQRLIKEGLLLNKCDCCTLGNEWNGKILSLQLDHKNGISTDNRLLNLRLLCPNCHSQTSNYAGRSHKQKKEQTYCSCGKPKTPRAKQCISCSASQTGRKTSISRRKVSNRPERSVLDKMLETMSYSAIGRRFGVSDNTVRKWLK